MIETTSSQESQPINEIPSEHCEVLQATNAVFYNVDNLPIGDRHDWERRMIYRVFLRSLYPPAIWQINQWYSIHLGLINEMSLFPQNALQKGVKFECYVQALAVDFPERVLDGIEVELATLNEAERRWTGDTELHWPGYSGGRGAISVRVMRTTRHVPESFLLKIGIIRGSEEDKLFVMPLVVGPFIIARDESQQVTGEEMLFFYRQLPLESKSDATSIIIQESPEIAIPGKIWDSALFSSRAALSTLREYSRNVDCPRVLDLSCGTGVCGIWLSAILGQSYDAAEVILSDLEEAVPVMNANIRLNKHLISPGITTKVTVLPWGDSSLAQTVGPLDVVIACDLIYETELLPLLLETIDALTTPRRTSVIIGYKQRGLTKEEKESLWASFAELFQVEKLVPALGCMDRECFSDRVGVELWRLWKD